VLGSIWVIHESLGYPAAADNVFVPNQLIRVGVMFGSIYDALRSIARSVFSVCLRDKPDDLVEYFALVRRM
jgi:hypothetical protein